MIKTLTLDGLTSVTIKQSAYDMARFCWLYNHSGSDIFASCVNSECTENADNVLRIPAGEPRMIDTESYETLYLNGSGTVELITSAYSVCPFNRAAKGGGTSLSGSASYTINNAVDYPLMGLNLYGKSTQDGTPTPENPVDIVSVGDSGSVEVTTDNGDSISTTVTITSALPLCGIPVSKGGNVTIDGQEYMADYVDFERGVKVQRIIVERMYGTTNGWVWRLRDDGTEYYATEHPYISLFKNVLNTQAISNAFLSGARWNYNDKNKIGVSNGSKAYVFIGASTFTSLSELTLYLDNNEVYVYSELATPIETPLSETELQAYRKLQTYSGVTNVSNDGGADMDVKYCTDKSLSEYVMPVITNMQAQIDVLKSAVLSLGSNV